MSTTYPPGVPPQAPPPPAYGPGPPPAYGPGPPPAYGPGPPAPPQRNPWKIGALVGAGVLVAAGAGIGIAAATGAFSGNDTTQSQPTTPGTTTPTAPTTPTQPSTQTGAAAVPNVADPQPASLPMSPQDIVNEMMGSTASDGTTVTAVKVIQTPVVLTNGLEIAEVNESFTDGTTYHMHMVFNPATNDGHMHTQYQINSIDSTEGLNDEFAETNVSDSVAAGTSASQVPLTYHSSFNGHVLDGVVMVQR